MNRSFQKLCSDYSCKRRLCSNDAYCISSHPFLKGDKAPSCERHTRQRIRPLQLKAVSEAHNQLSLIHCLSMVVCLWLRLGFPIFKNGNEQKRALKIRHVSGISELLETPNANNCLSSAMQVNKQGADKSFSCSDKLKTVCTTLRLSFHLKGLLARHLHCLLSHFARLPAAVQHCWMASTVLHASGHHPSADAAPAACYYFGMEGHVQYLCTSLSWWQALLG